MSVTNARRILYGIGAVLLLVLAVSGVWLWFRYRPTVAQAWNDTLNPHLEDEQRFRIVHRFASHALLLVALALGLLHLAGARGIRWALGLWVLATAGAAAITGYLLPWDQLALNAVTVGSDLGGMAALWDSDVRFVLIGGVEVAPGTIMRWAVVHVAIPVVAVLVPAAWLASRRRRPTTT